MLDHQLNSISQFVFSSQNYVQDCNDFRERKNKIFSVQEKSRFIRNSEEPSEDSCNHLSPRYQPQRTLPQTTNFILRLNSGQQVQQVCNDVRRNFSNIIVLDISNARISHLPDLAVCQMPVLQILNLQNNLISELPQTVYRSNLVQLNVNNNLIKNLKCEQPWQEHLERLDVGRNHIRYLPSGLWKCLKLSTLDVRNNDFEILSAEIIGLEKTMSALGLDWVKYSMKKYHADRVEILVDELLTIFWKVVHEIIQPTSGQFLDENHEDDYVVTCWDFCRVYDQTIAQLEKHTNLPELDDRISYMSERRPNDHQGTYLSRQQAPFQQQDDQDVPEPQDLPIPTDEIQNTESTKRRPTKMNSNFIMHMAVRGEDLGVLRSLLRFNRELADEIDQDGHTPLSLAIQEEKYHCAKILLNAHVDVNLGGGVVGSCINLAIGKQQYFLLRDLLSANGKPNGYDKQGNGPFHYLIPVFRKSTIEAVKMAYLLLDAGADPNHQNQSGQTAIQIAVKRNIVNAVKFAIQHNFESGHSVFDFKLRYKKDNSTSIKS